MKRIHASPGIFLTVFAFLCSCLHADDALFIGNSFTDGGPEQALHQHGGVPKLVELIAAAKGKQFSSVMLFANAGDFVHPLQLARLDEILGARKWDWVVLQDYSLEATHIGYQEGFLKNGEFEYRRIKQNSPKAVIVLYESWSRGAGHESYTGVSTRQTFVDVAQMDAEIRKSYVELQRRLQAIDPATPVALAPVNEAFARSLAKYPGIDLHFTDKRHGSTAGSYLAALVIYATIYHDSPKGAPQEFFGISLDPGVAVKLQEIADEVAGPKAK